ncbi:MAG TPA: alpha/beta hydrolase [Chitinophagaceae bacterium]
MKNKKSKRRLRIILIWVSWALLFQIILINISAALYADKLTYLYTPDTDTWTKPVSNNIFAKTWRLFTGPKFYRQSITDTPHFSFTTIYLETSKKIPVETWYAKTDSTPKGTVILFHGLMGHKGHVIREAAEFRRLGYHVMMVDTRGHGNSGGNVITIGYREAEEVKLGYDYIKQAGEKNILLWGASMGAVEILKAISDHDLKPAGIIVEMPFLSLQSHLEGRARTLGFPEQPFGFLTSFWIGVERGFNGWGFQTTEYAKKVSCPVLMQYGDKDELVLPYETEAIYNALASKTKRLVVYDNAVHEQFLQKDPAAWTREVETFLKQIPATTF